MTAIDKRSHGTATAGTRGARSDSGKRSTSTLQHTPDGRPADDRAGAAYHILNDLCQRDDGWLRVVPHPLDDVLYIKWKFNKGKHSGCYVMSRVTSWQLDYGLDLLLDKLHAVDSGDLRPTRDTAYDA